MDRARARPGGGERRPAGRLFCIRRIWLARATLVLGLALAPPLAAVAAAGEACPADRIDAWAEVRSVLDGDTLVLKDGRKVRMLGINSPEIRYDQRPTEPFATVARSALEELTGAGQRVGLRFDVERQDTYGRTLAHVFLPDGTNVQREMLARGLAASIVVPPNAWGWECYRDAEREVREAGRGMWSDERFRPTPPAQLPTNADGFWFVTGRVQRVGEGRNAWWLNLGGGLSVRIDKRDMEYFPGLRPRSLAGQRIESRGWLNSSPRDRWVNARHPAALRVLD